MGQAQNISSTLQPAAGRKDSSATVGSRTQICKPSSPAQCDSALEFEPGLVNLILQEVATKPDSLQLLEYALKEMWRRRQSQGMGHASQTVGKVEGAISQHADAGAWLPEAEQAAGLARTQSARARGGRGG